ncbi:MAG: F0F1 ATP synthase subunit A [Anaerovoracaceae bacterium]
MNIGPHIVLKFGDSGVFITDSVIFGAIVAIVLTILFAWMTRNMQRVPQGKQAVAEIIVEGIYTLVENTMGKKAVGYAPYIGTLFIWLLAGNMLGLIGIKPYTSDVNTTFAMALVTFILIQRQAIKSHGFVGKLKEMGQPYPFMFPLKIIEQVSFPVSLAFRIFGNILGGVIVMELLFEGLHAASEALSLPIPLLQTIIPLPANFFFDVFEPILQAFIFVMLTMVFISMEIATNDDEH